DEASGGAVTTNTGTLGGQACSVSEATATTTPPTVTDVLGYGSVSGFGNASQYGAGELIGWDENNNGAYDGDNGSTPSADQIAMGLLNMGNGGQTPWTLEAVIQPTVTNVNQEIISTDSSSVNRGFQFRLNQSGQLELNLIAPGIDIQTPIPSSGFHAFVPGNWYHVAAAYDGTNVVLYWTKMDPSVSAANAISTNAASVGASFGLVQGPLTIGNENRAAAGEYFRGRIDEVRLSSIARAPDQMLFGLDPVAAPTASVATTAIAPSPTVYAGTTATLSATVSGVSATAFAWQSDGGSGGMVWTNLSGSVTNSYSLDTTGIAAGAYQFRLIVFAANGSLTNNPATLTVLAASGPVLVSDTVVTPANATAGSTVSVSAAFAGTLPMAYQWYFIPPSGVTNAVAGATSTTLTIPNVQTNEAGNYFLVASNNPPGLGSQVAASSPASLTLAASYFKESTGMFCDLLEHPEETTITASTPTFGWYYPVSCRNDYQTGYRLIVASSQTLADAGAGDLWDSGVVSSSNSINVAYHGTALQPNTSYFWRVQTLNRFGQTNAFSAVQQFNTGSALSDPLARPGAVYQQPGAGSANVYPLRYVAVSPVVVTNTGAGTWFIDFGRDAFGFATVHLAGNYSGTTVGFGLGEAASGYNVNTSPGATIRYWSGSYALKNGDFIYTNRSTTAVGAISPPVGTFGIVSPFRYLQLTGVPAGVTLTAADLTQWRLETEFDPGAAAFSSSSPVLNQVWDLCHYSMEALTFDGIYVDGDRERTPYEADSYIHQLCAYGADNDFTMARCSFEYLTNHLTWPTEWPMHMIFIAWADYQHTGDPYLITKYYGFLTNKCLYLSNSRPNGLLWSYPQTGNNHTTNPSDIIDWYRVSGDGIGNVDGYVAEGTNAVINAFYYRCLTLMSQMAQVTGHTADATNFNSLAAQVYTNYNSAFWNAGSQSYVDGIGTTHSSADANFYPLAFGLVPTNQQAAVVNYLHSRIAALGA
ncbi:MAG TPA: LamG-like jellyroll fold domain-containing protein, partial [Verrucomicrobiae bacterium]|nr:LamG-like jellyroll fold domain-containing protein [Verrucomicrobiae bacterium]